MLTMSELIHPTVILDPQAEIAPDVQIGPYSIIEGPVRIGPGCVIEGHVALSGPLEMGRDNFVGHGAVLGKSPQHKGYQGEQTWLRIGDGNVFREQVTVHRGTEQGGVRPGSVIATCLWSGAILATTAAWVTAVP